MPEKDEMDNETKIRAALERGLQITSKEPCGPSNDLMTAGLAALTAMQEERRAETLRDAAHVNENGEVAAMLRAECERLRAVLVETRDEIRMYLKPGEKVVHVASEGESNG